MSMTIDINERPAGGHTFVVRSNGVAIRTGNAATYGEAKAAARQAMAEETGSVDGKVRGRRLWPQRAITVAIAVAVIEAIDIIRAIVS